MRKNQSGSAERANAVLRQLETKREFLMNVIRALAGALAVFCFGVGTLMLHRFEEAFALTLVLAGAIILSGLLVSLSIADKDKK